MTASLLVDTLFDLRLTKAMLDGLAPLTAGLVDQFRPMAGREGWEAPAAP